MSELTEHNDKHDKISLEILKKFTNASNMYFSIEFTGNANNSDSDVSIEFTDTDSDPPYIPSGYDDEDEADESDFQLDEEMDIQMHNESNELLNIYEDGKATNIGKFLLHINNLA